MGAEISEDDEGDDWVNPRERTNKSNCDVPERPVLGEGLAAWAASVRRHLYFIVTITDASLENNPIPSTATATDTFIFNKKSTTYGQSPLPRP